MSEPSLCLVVFRARVDGGALHLAMGLDEAALSARAGFNLAETLGLISSDFGRHRSQRWLAVREALHPLLAPLDRRGAIPADLSSPPTPWMAPRLLMVEWRAKDAARANDFLSARRDDAALHFADCSPRELAWPGSRELIDQDKILDLARQGLEALRAAAEARDIGAALPLAAPGAPGPRL